MNIAKEVCISLLTDYFSTLGINDFLQYSWEMLIHSYNTLNNCELEINDYIENGLLEIFHTQLRDN